LVRSECRGMLKCTNGLKLKAPRRKKSWAVAKKR
jgi:hypothetical protein